MYEGNQTIVCFGETLWDILPTGAKPGGAPMNVAYHLKKLGVEPVMISRIGLDDYGRKLIDMLDNAGIQTEYFQIDSKQSTGVVYAKPNEFGEVVYDIVYPVAWDFIEPEEEVKKLVASAGYFVYGSLVTRNQISRHTLYELLEIANRRVLDINLRAPYFNKKFVTHLLAQAHIAKMNLAELELITGWFGQSKTIGDRIQLLQDQFRIETIIVTRGAEGATVNYQGELLEHAGYTVAVADTVGSGDAFLAAFLHSLLQKEPVARALSFASGLGAFVATQHGACPHYHISDVTEFLTATSLSAIKP